MKQMEEDKKEDKIDIGAADQNMSAAIQFTKSQLWNMANYSLLMQGAAVGAFELLWNSTECIFKWTRIPFAILAVIASIMIAVYTSKLFKAYKTDLERYQGIIDKFTTRDPNNYSYRLRLRIL